ncbi:uncharacterized protein BDZ83DRAFT_756990 [Colletotrichum acutatum]|uniref:DUF6604 domain-containing protein n=1 Tax=Glomerella acutata TaxID=27357 RepID=A0AAD8XCE0_GLOAC|nr:uncharacterized protein BDZ83DRAFT_756990 [Colletotrichum acutatum]KAK1712626.1 hypothetical protein BDZ83DRAFT_756990 [Colletotrichum acutatum]
MASNEVGKVLHESNTVGPLSIIGALQHVIEKRQEVDNIYKSSGAEDPSHKHFIKRLEKTSRILKPLVAASKRLPNSEIPRIDAVTLNQFAVLALEEEENDDDDDDVSPILPSISKVPAAPHRKSAKGKVVVRQQHCKVEIFLEDDDMCRVFEASFLLYQAAMMRDQLMHLCTEAAKRTLPIPVAALLTSTVFLLGNQLVGEYLPLNSEEMHEYCVNVLKFRDAQPEINSEIDGMFNFRRFCDFYDFIQLWNRKEISSLSTATCTSLNTIICSSEETLTLPIDSALELASQMRTAVDFSTEVVKASLDNASHTALAEKMDEFHGAMDAYATEDCTQFYYRAPWTAGGHMGEILFQAQHMGRYLAGCSTGGGLCIVPAPLYLYNALRPSDFKLAKIPIMEESYNLFKANVFRGDLTDRNFLSIYRRIVYGGPLNKAKSIIEWKSNEFIVTPLSSIFCDQHEVNHKTGPVWLARINGQCAPTTKAQVEKIVKKSSLQPQPLTTVMHMAKETV